MIQSCGRARPSNKPLYYELATCCKISSDNEIVDIFLPKNFAGFLSCALRIFAVKGILSFLTSALKQFEALGLGQNGGGLRQILRFSLKRKVCLWKRVREKVRTDRRLQKLNSFVWSLSAIRCQQRYDDKDHLCTSSLEAQAWGKRCAGGGWTGESWGKEIRKSWHEKSQERKPRKRWQKGKFLMDEKKRRQNVLLSLRISMFFPYSI